MSELGLLFLKLGTIAFGGPAAHVAMMRDEVVTRRRWISDREFLDLVAATNLIPGPNSTELAIHIGYRRAGWPGLLVAGAAFILPATLIVGALAWGYVRYGATPEVRSLFYGVGPVVIAIVLHALLGMAKTAITSVWLGAIAVLSAVAVLLGVHELAVLAGAGLLALAHRSPGQARSAGAGFMTAMFLKPLAIDAGLSSIFVVFLKTGAVLFGSGYVLLAFLRADLVERLGWLTESQLVDAIAIGQFTPGPVFTTATFIGYLLGGAPGAAAATIGIFLPAFIYVAISAPFIARLRASKPLAAVLDGVTVASLALMAVVAMQLGRVSLVDLTTVVLALAACGLLLATRINSAWVIAIGAICGLLSQGLASRL